MLTRLVKRLHNIALSLKEQGCSFFAKAGCRERNSPITTYYEAVGENGESGTMPPKAGYVAENTIRLLPPERWHEIDDIAEGMAGLRLGEAMPVEVYKNGRWHVCAMEI